MRTLDQELEDEKRNSERLCRLANQNTELAARYFADLQSATARAEAAERELAASKATIAGLVEALRPFGRTFAEVVGKNKEWMHDGIYLGITTAATAGHHFEAGDLRRAARAVAEVTAGTKESKQ